MRKLFNKSAISGAIISLEWDSLLANMGDLELRIGELRTYTDMYVEVQE